MCKCSNKSAKENPPLPTGTLPIRPRRKQQMQRPQIRTIPQHRAPTAPAREPILVAQPDQQALLPRPLGHLAHQVDKLPAEVRRRLEPVPRLDMEPAHAHGAELLHLAEQPVGVQGSGPAP
jgi:hypothetical protein